ncbi:MAG: hypothetical protein HY332_04090 [Chloroflexi bacterium]|nr:hypothetical protein [Chloroflexota bacterium]
MSESPAASLAHLLDAYDRANRLEIDAVYAQLSPTLDDYYAEELRLVFPQYQQGIDEVRPEIVLTRTIPGLVTRAAHAPGAPFPLARAAALVRQSLAGSSDERARRLLERLTHGEAWLAARQRDRTQAVYLAVEPEGRDVAEWLNA